MAGKSTGENNRATVHDEINREAARLGITPQAEIRRRAEDQFREEHYVRLARIMLRQNKELEVASPDDRAETMEQHAPELVGVRRLLDFEVRQVAASIEHAYLSHELDEKGRVPIATGSPALETRHALEEAALEDQHIDDTRILRAEQEAGQLDSVRWHEELADLAKLHDDE